MNAADVTAAVRPVGMGAKRCWQCKQTLPFEAFGRNRDERDGHAARCKACLKADRKARPEVYRKYKRNTHLRVQYNIGIDDFERLMVAAGGRCQICGASGSKSIRKKHLCIDHDHTTGRIRGILCDTCNRGIGLLGDNPDRIRAAASYLEINDANQQ